MQRKFQQAYHIPGTLSADLNIRSTVPSNCTLVHVSAVASNDSDALITIGTSADADGFLASCVIGDSNTPVEKDLGDFDGALLTLGASDDEYPRLSDGDILVIALDYDGDGGTAADDVTIVLTFAEG